MISKIAISGFKSFHNFEMDLAPFTLIAGANSSGKSNLFDALALISALANSSNLKTAFATQRGELIELFTQYAPDIYAEEMSFMVEVLLDRQITDSWGQTVDLDYTRLRYSLKIKRSTDENSISSLRVLEEKLERILVKEDAWIKHFVPGKKEYWRPKSIGRQLPFIQTKGDYLQLEEDAKGSRDKRFPLKQAQRTILSTVDTIDYPHALALKEAFSYWQFLQLQPEELRKATAKAAAQNALGQQGQNMAGNLQRLIKKSPKLLAKIRRNFNRFLPHFIDLEIVEDQLNKAYVIRLQDQNKQWYSAKLLSEGTLRILALCIMLADPMRQGLLCLEEPENGLHPARIKDMADLLEKLTTDFKNKEEKLQQLIVNTHSPLFVQEVYEKKSLGSLIGLARISSRLDIYQNKNVNFNHSQILPINSPIRPLLKGVKAISLRELNDYLGTRIIANEPKKH